MSIAELKAEVDRLSPEDTKQLMAYIAKKRRLLTPEVIEELSRKIDDNDPSHWLTLEEFGKRLGFTE
jgi:hypothetical protein